MVNGFWEIIFAFGGVMPQVPTGRKPIASPVDFKLHHYQGHRLVDLRVIRAYHFVPARGRADPIPGRGLSDKDPQLVWQ